MSDFIFVNDLPEVKVILTAGPSYFGSLHLAREVALTLLQASLIGAGTIVVENRQDPTQEVGIRLDVNFVGNDELARQIEAAIHQTMMLRPQVMIKVIFREVDVMLPDVSDYLAKAVTESQKGLRDWGNMVADRVMWLY